MDPYAELGLPPGAPPEDIAAAYRRLAKAYHPDRGGAEGRMAQINAAYDLLRAAEWMQRNDPAAAAAAPRARARAAAGTGSRPRSAARSATSC